MKRLLHVALLLLTTLVPARAGGTPSTLRLDARPLGLTAEVSAVRAVPRSGSPNFDFPTHVRAVLSPPGTRWAPRYPAEEAPAYVALYPVAGLEQQYPELGPYSVRAQIQRLDALRLGKTSVARLARPLPHLPVRNAAQAVAGAARPLSTQQFVGLRYLTIYSQEWGVRFPREATYYTFQGMTRDGRFVVVAHLPHGPRALPTLAERDRTGAYEVAPMPTPSTGPAAEAYNQKVVRYRADVTRLLDAESDTPALARLDALVRSIRLH